MLLKIWEDPSGPISSPSYRGFIDAVPWGLSPPELRTVLLYFMAAGPTDLLRWARVRERAWRDGGRRFLNGRNGGGRYKLEPVRRPGRRFS